MIRGSMRGAAGGPAAGAVVVMAGIAGMAAGPAAAGDGCLTFPDFADVSLLTLNAAAEVVTTGDGPVLRVCPDLGGSGGSFFLTTPVSAATFSTSFTFRIANRGGATFDCNTTNGADGIVFVVQTVANDVGGIGGGIGYSGIAPSIGVEFDTWCNAALNDPSPNHVGLLVNGDVNHGPGSSFTATVEPEFEDGDLWTAWVDYDGTTLEARVALDGVRPDEALVARELDLAEILGQDTAFIGFTSGTGSAWANHDIVSWTYDRFVPAGCPDLDLDGAVDFDDVLEVLSLWGDFTTGCVPDFDASGDVGFGDLLEVLGAFGPCP